MPGDSKNTFLHQKDVLDLGDHVHAVTTTHDGSLLFLAYALVQTYSSNPPSMQRRMLSHTCLSILFVFVCCAGCMDCPAKIVFPLS